MLPSTDRQMVQRIDDLIKNIKATPFQAIGKPEPLKYDLSGWWSRRITKEHRLVYRVKGNPGPLEIALEIMQCRYHY